MSNRYSAISASVATLAGTAIDFPYSGRIVAIDFTVVGLGNAGNTSEMYTEVSKLNSNQLAAGSAKDVVASCAVASVSAGAGIFANKTVPCNETVKAGERWYYNQVNAGGAWARLSQVITFIFA